MMKALPNKHYSGADGSIACASSLCGLHNYHVAHCAIEEEGRRAKSTPRESWRQQQKTELNGDEWSVECFPLSDKALVR